MEIAAAARPTCFARAPLRAMAYARDHLAGDVHDRNWQSTSALEVQSTAMLEAQITELAGHLNAANHRLLVLIAEFDRRKGWADSATQSCAHWLSWKCGLDVGAAREKVRVARALESLPLISSAMARGELSYSKVRALTRVAGPETEELLLSIALHGTAHHVETTVRCFRRAQQAEELSREARQQAARRVSYSYDADGSLVVKAVLPAETGALFVKALNAALKAMEQQEKILRKGSAVTFQRKRRRCVHEGGVTLQVLDDGTLRFGMKDGRTLDSPRPARLAEPARPAAEQIPLAADVLQGDWTHLLATHSAHRIGITPDTAVTRWRGESMDYSTAVDALLHRARQATSPSSTVVH